MQQEKEELLREAMHRLEMEKVQNQLESQAALNDKLIVEQEYNKIRRLAQEYEQERQRDF